MATPPSGRDSPSGDSTKGASDSAPGPSEATTVQRPSSRNSSSPETSCVICLEEPSNKAIPDSCFHQFCYSCIVEWANVSAKCPLCKQAFSSIKHSIKSSEHYDRYVVDVQPRTPEIASVHDTRISVRDATSSGGLRELDSTQHRRESGMQAPWDYYVNMRNPIVYILMDVTRQRLQLYERDLWTVPHIYYHRHMSPELYIDRLVPWLNRELRELMEGDRGLADTAVARVLSLISSFHIKDPNFAREMEPFIHRYTEHFVHEFYLFANSTIETMADYDRGTTYGSRFLAIGRLNAIESSWQSFPESQQAAALVPRAAPLALTYESPQPGPSGLAVSRAATVTSSVDNDSESDSSDCAIVSVQGPLRERTPDVIELMSSDEDDDWARELLHGSPRDYGGCPSDLFHPSEDNSAAVCLAMSDSSSSDAGSEHN